MYILLNVFLYLLQIKSELNLSYRYIFVEQGFSDEVSLCQLFVEFLTSLIHAAVIRINKEQGDAKCVSQTVFDSTL